MATCTCGNTSTPGYDPDFTGCKIYVLEHDVDVGIW